MADRTLVVPSTTSPHGAPSHVLDEALRATVSTLWFGAVMDTSGHADELRGFVRALERYGYEPAVREMRWTDSEAGLSPTEVEQLKRQMKRTPSAPFVTVHEYLPSPNQHSLPGVNVSRVMYETDRLPPDWITPLLDRDELWVPSRFNVETFARSGVPEDRLKVLGGTLDFDSFAPGAEPWPLGAPAGAFTFLTNFDFSERKGWKQLLLAWAKAFSRDDDVCLVLKTGSFYIADSSVEDKIYSFLHSELGSAADRLAPIRIMTDRLPSAGMPRLYAGADAYVLPSRGEGWGRPFMEALAIGLPTVASNWSANLEFMDPETSWLVDGELVDVADDAEIFNPSYKGHKWFEADVDALAAVMREIASEPAAARAKAAPARDELIRRFGAEATAHRIGELAASVWERHAERRTRPAQVAIRGGFGSVDSLAVVNDALAGELEGKGLNVQRRAPQADALEIPAPSISQSWPPVFEPATAGPTVMVLHWEFGAPPREWVDQARRCADRVIVSSDYVRRGYVEGGMPPGIVEVIPCGADLEHFTPDGPRFELPRTAGTTFLFVGGTTWRKGADILVEGWRRAFGPDDDVQLVVKDFGVGGAYRNQTAGDEIKKLAAGGTTAPIVYIDDELHFDELPSLYRAADVVVLPYRGEGFCLPALEAMACGVPVIHNGEGPTGEFVGDIGGWSLPAERVPLPPEAKLPELAAPGYVHEVDADALAERLRAVAADAAGRRERAERAVVRAAAYNWSAFADRVTESLATLEREGLPLARHLRHAEIEARSRVVVYAPDWRDEQTWAAALESWIATVDRDADITLALYVSGDAAAIGDRVMALLARHDEKSLPDMALVEPSSVTLTALTASADAVLTDGPTDPAERPELLRRARRIVPADANAIRVVAQELGV
jgi:glycosyltransferase involved in cell wall biosynthesis